MEVEMAISEMWDGTDPWVKENTPLPTEQMLRFFREYMEPTYTEPVVGPRGDPTPDPELLAAIDALRARRIGNSAS